MMPGFYSPGLFQGRAVAQSCTEVTPAMCASGAAKLELFTHKQLIRPKPPLKTRREDGYDRRIICFCVSDIGLVIPTVENPHSQQQHGFKKEHKSLQNKTFLWNFNDNLDIYLGMAQ